MKEDSTLIIHLSFSLVFTFMVNQDVKRKIGLKNGNLMRRFQIRHLIKLVSKTYQSLT